MTDTTQFNFTPADMATAAAQGFRDGQHSMQLPAAGQEPVAPLNDAAVILSKICDLLHIGKQARTESTILVNVENVIRFAGLLHALERELFPQPELPEDDDPYAIVADDLPAPNCWGAKDEADYVAQFRAALAARGAAPQPAVTNTLTHLERTRCIQAIRTTLANWRCVPSAHLKEFAELVIAEIEKDKS